MELLIVSVASLFAGFVDSIVGGGGLILVPALFATFPNAHPATLFGTNKGASVWGTGMATWQYSQKVHMRWSALLPAAGAGLLASFAGAWLVTAAAKLVNTATNVSALALFIAKGHIWWHFVLAMALANVVGSLAGTRLALKHGTGFVRVVFLLVVSALILKTSYDAFLR